jgi:hypothetical protein
MLNLSQAFQSYFTNAIVSVKKILMQQFMQLHLKVKKQFFILGTGSNCSYFDGKELHQKYNH